MFRNIIKHLSPFSLIAIMALVGGIYFLLFRDVNAGWQVFGLAFLFLLGGILIVDYFMKKVLKLSMLKLWIVQLLLLVAGFYFWVIN